MQRKNGNHQENNQRSKNRRIFSLSSSEIQILLIINLALLVGFILLARKTKLGQILLLGSESSSAEEQGKQPGEGNTAGQPEAGPTATVGIVVSGATYEPGISSKYPDMVVLSLSEAGYYNLFAYSPEDLSMTRLTDGDWDDIEPAVSPDGKRVAFASNKLGYWDIYILDLTTGKTSQITDDEAYDGSPSWSPDSQWLAFEKYQENNLDIYILPSDGSLDAIRVTFDAGVDTSPTWRPDGGQLSFATSRNGDFDIYTLDIQRLDQPDSQRPLITLPGDQTKPVWSPDGKRIAWISEYDNYPSIYIADTSEKELSPQHLGGGTLALWDPSARYILAGIDSSNEVSLAVYDVQTRTYKLPPQILPGNIQGISWGTNPFLNGLPAAIHVNAIKTPYAPWADDTTFEYETVNGRYDVVELPDVKAPTASLSELAFDSFDELRIRVDYETGWDVLSDLENLFVPLTAPLSPGLSEDWLYTGRAFALNRVLLTMNYMLVTRENYGGQTYWRIFLRPLEQDGSQGKPLTQYPWDFYARFSGNTASYEEGGARLEEIPPGYWVDFTDLAGEYGWSREAALSNWRSYFQGSRFNQLVFTSGLTWEEAMLQLYPPEIFMQPISPTQ